MPNWSLEDDNGGHIAYSSGWVLKRGSTRQWDGAVHSTDTIGATATIRFIGALSWSSS